MKLYAYARYSSDNQREKSIDEQFREINDYCIANNHIILRKYSDYALSGKFDVRPHFDKMLNDCENDAECDGIIFFDLTRFSRGGDLGIFDNIRLAKHGKILVSVTENISDNDFSGKIVRYIKLLMAEEDLTKLSLNVKRGKRETALSCEWNGGTPPLGYDVVNKKLVVNPKEAEAVKLIFNRIAEGVPYSKLIIELNSLGYRTKSGNEFKKTSIHELLHNKKYIGVWEYGKMITIKNQYTKTQSTVHADDKDIITFENACEPIIDKKLWDKVQVIKTQRKKSTKAKVDYYLTGKIVCSECGSPYVGSSIKSHDKRDYYYICSGKKNGKACYNRNIRKENLEKCVFNCVSEQLQNGNLYLLLSSIVDKYNASGSGDNEKINKQLDKDIEKLKKRLAKAREAFLDGVFTQDEYKEQQITCNAQIAQLNNQKLPCGKVEINKKMLEETCNKFVKQIDIKTALDLCDWVAIDYEKIQVAIGQKFTTFDADSVGGDDGS